MCVSYILHKEEMKVNQNCKKTKTNDEFII